MKHAVKVFTFLVILFLLMNSLSAMLPTMLSPIFKVLATFLLIFVGYNVSLRLKTEREEAAGLAEAGDTLLLPTKGVLLSPMPLAAPIIALTFLISYLTSLLFGLFGVEGAAVASAPLYEMLIVHALLPAVLEESVFRYLPMKLIAPYSRRWCAVLSAVYFALAHMSALQLPYALCAGFVFIAVDLMYDSVWPSLIMHLLNNAVSVLWIKYSSSQEFVLWFVAVMAAAALLSLIGVYLKRREYKMRISSALREGEHLTEYYAPMLYIGFCTVMVVLNTFS